MRKLLFALGLFISLFTFGQGVNVLHTTSYPITTGAAAPSYSTEYQAVYDEFTTPPTTYDEDQDQLVIDLVAAGYWARIDAMWVFAQETNGGGEAYLNWKDPTGTDAVGINSPTFTANEGFTGNDNNMAVNLNFIPSSDGVNFTQNDATVVFYSRTAAAQDAETSVGGGDGTRSIFCSPYYVDEGAYWSINTGGYVGQTNSDGTGAGCFSFTRTGATATRVYRNGAAITDEQANGSNGLPTVTQYALAFNNNGSIDEPSSRQISIVLYMDGTADAADADGINDIIETFADAVGFGVQ